MIVGALFLQCNTATMTYKSLYPNIKRIYNYLRRRDNVKMIMNEMPTRISILNTIEKLGFPYIEEKSGRKSKGKNYVINMDPKKDQKMILGLSYYSESLL